METEIEEYFRQFGDVNDVEMDDLQSGFVEFKSVEAAKTALSSVVHRLANCDMEVKEAEPWHQPDHILNALNDDCLRKIFKYLNLYDLMEASQVSVRFNQHGKDEFSAKYKRLEVKESDLYGRRTYYFERMLRIFGKLICSLSIESCDNHRSLLRMISEHTTFQLKEVTLKHFRIDEYVNINLTLSNLQILELIGCSVSNLSEILTVCTQLKILKIINVNTRNRRHTGHVSLPVGRLSQRFAELEEVHLIGCLSDHDINSLITLNSPLKKLVIVNNMNTRLLAPTIIQQHPNLEELVLYQYVNENVECKETFHEQLKCLSQPFCSLKTLKLDFRFFSVAPLMKILAINQVPIEELVLKNGRVDSDEISILTQLKKIKSLKLLDIDRFTDEH